MSDFLVKISLVPIVVAETAQPWTTETQREPFFEKSKLLGLSRQIGPKMHLGYFRPIYQHPIWYCESLVYVFQ